MKYIHILSGVPGCGKSTLANRLSLEAKSQGMRAAICSADHFFYDEDGEYQFDPRKLGEAHSDCMADFLLHLADSAVDVVIVDNTNTTKWERQNYSNACLLLPRGTWTIYYHEFEVGADQLEECHRRCTHGVPLEAIQAMHARFEPMYDPIIHCFED